MIYNRYITFRASDEHRAMLEGYDLSRLLRYMIENKDELLGSDTLAEFVKTQTDEGND